MARAREIVKLFGCTCGAHWWTRLATPNPGHQCPAGYPSGGIALGLYEEARHPQSDGE